MRELAESRPVSVFLAVAALAVGGCESDAAETAEMQSGRADTAPSAITSADMDALRSAFLEAMEAGDFAAAAALYVPDAVFHHADGTKSRGTAEIEQHLAASAEGVTMSDVSLTPNDFGGGPAIAWETGTFSATVTPQGGEPMPVSHNYLVVVERQPDGSLLLVQDAEWPAPEA
jgi:uncharacterized protein (TIGR02246 family)